MKKVAICLLLATFLTLIGCSQGSTLQESGLTFFSMNTVISLTAYGSDAETALTKVQKRVFELEDKWSVTNYGSEVYNINHSDGIPLAVSNDTLELIKYSLAIAKRTDGAFEPTIYPVVSLWGFTTGEFTVPTDEEISTALGNIGYDKVAVLGNEVTLQQGMSLDFGGVGKGYSLDEALSVLRTEGITSALLNFGGNIGMLGAKPDGGLWKIGVAKPQGKGNIGTLSLSDCTIATSGNYQRYFEDKDGNRYGHIMNPATGSPQDSDMLSVTVISSEGKLCDALATAIYVMGLEKALALWKGATDFEMLLVMTNNVAYITEGIAAAFENESSELQLNTIKRQEAEQ